MVQIQCFFAANVAEPTDAAMVTAMRSVLMDTVLPTAKERSAHQGALSVRDSCGEEIVGR